MTRFTELEQVCYGLTDQHLQQVAIADHEYRINPQACQAFIRLQAAALKAGFDLQPVSIFRGFERQLQIVERKARGERVLSGDDGEPLDFDRLSDDELLKAIMRWSALPGLSRHHWGTDLDVFDAHRMAREAVQLVPAEVASGGPCGAMHDWLDAQIAANQSFGFFRPYASDYGAIAPERWHLSYLPLAATYQKALQPEQVLSLWEDYGFSLADKLESRLAQWWPAYVDVRLDAQPDWVQSMMAAAD